MTSPLPLNPAPTSGAVAVSECQDTATGSDLGWLTIPAILVVVVVIAVIVHFARAGGRGR